jgi:tellurite resistance-related uncharacterized protein
MIFQEEKMKTKRLLYLFVICTFILASCASARTSQPLVVTEKGSNSYNLDSSGVSAPMASQELAAVPSADAAGSGLADATSTSSTTDQMIVKTASLNILVDDPSQSLEDIMKLADDLKGYTVSSNRYQSYSSSGEQLPSANVVIRVPADKLTDAMDKIKAMTGEPGKYVTNENVSGQDVTQAYTDLQSRLRNLEEAADELTKMYNKAVKAEDVLAIYNQKMSVTEQIEVLKGQIKYYEDASATSSITVQIDAKASVQPISVAGWEPKGIARDAVQALINFLKGLANFLIWLVILVLPILIVIGLPLYFLIRWLVRRNKAKKVLRNQVPPIPTEKQ